MVQILIYVGPELVGQATAYPSFLMKDEINICKKIKFKLFTKNKEAMEQPFLYSYLPKEARLGITMWAVSTNLEMVCLGSAGTTVFDQNGVFKSYCNYNQNEKSARFDQSEDIKESEQTERSQEIVHEIILWPLKRFPKDISCYGSNYTSETYSPKFTILLKFEEFIKPMKYNREYNEEKHKEDIYNFYIDLENLKEFERRSQYKDNPSKLPIIMKTINWCSIEMRHQALISLKQWASIRDIHALSLLQHEIVDSEVREFAIHKLSKVSNRMLAHFMPQLVQALKFESHHTSSLAEMLLNRAIKSPRIVGHAYFWALNASLYDPYTFERLYLHYERFLFLTPHYRTELYFQSRINDAIIDTNYQAVNDKHASMEDLLEFVNRKLQEIMTEFNVNYFILPHLPSVPLVKINKLKAMDSKLKPILLNCSIQTKGSEPKYINALFK